MREMPSDLPDRERHSGDAHRRGNRTAVAASLAERLGLPSGLDPAVRLSALFYLAHILCLGWNASATGLLALSLIAAAFALRKGRLRIPFHPLYLPLLVYCLASAISNALRPNRWNPSPELSESFYFLSFPLGIALLSAIPSLARPAIRALTITALFLSSYGLVQFFFLGYHERELERRITASLSHVMTFSGMMVAMSLVLIVVALRNRDRLVILAAVLTSTALLLTFTRGAWIGWASGLLVIAMNRRPRWLLYMAPVLVLAITFSPLPFFARMMSTFDLQQASNLDRIRMIEAGAAIITDYPIFGVGPTNVREVYPLYRSEDAPRFSVPHLHNNVVQIWAERGLLALAAYVFIFALFIRECLRTPRTDPVRRSWATAGIAVAVALTTAGVFEYNFGDNEVLFTTLVIMGIVTKGSSQKDEG